MAVVITPAEDWSARSPRFSGDGLKLLYVVSADSAAHMSCSRLCVAAWGAKAPTGVVERKVVVDIVGEPGDEDFPGLFLASEQLPRRVWMGDGRHVVLHCDWRCQRELVVVDTEGCSVRKIHAGSDAGEVLT